MGAAHQVMRTALPYSYLLLTIAVALLFLIAVFLLRRRWRLHPTGLQALARARADDPTERETYREYLIPLMLYEEECPSFGRILSLVLGHFPLSRFLREEQFQSALTFLRDSAFQPFEGRRVAPSMAVVVRFLMEDPDVEYQCRKQLSGLLHQFLQEIEA